MEMHIFPCPAACHSKQGGETADSLGGRIAGAIQAFMICSSSTLQLFGHSFTPSLLFLLRTGYDTNTSS